jgi:hypothetical protein
MSFEKPDNNKKNSEEEKTFEIEGLSREELDELEGDEKYFAEFIEKRHQSFSTMGDLRTLDIPEEQISNIKEVIRYLNHMAYRRFEHMSEIRKAKIHNGIIDKMGGGVKISQVRD